MLVNSSTRAVTKNYFIRVQFSTETNKNVDEKNSIVNLPVLKRSVDYHGEQVET